MNDLNPELVALLRDLLARWPRSPNATMWDVQDIANAMSLSCARVYKLIELPDFPKACRFKAPDVKTHGFRRWKASDIIAWWDKHKER